MVQIVGSASQDPFLMARTAVQLGVGLLNGQKPPQELTLLPSVLVTRDNIGDYKGWNSNRTN
jgi:ribose transport system substrate-binding protein